MNNIIDSNVHIPVLVNQAIKYLPKKDHLNVIDATYGGGGYSKLIYKQSNIDHLIAIDRDPQVIQFTNTLVKKSNFKLLSGKFSQIDFLVSNYMKKNKIIGFDAIFFDLGLSSNQLNNHKRGFSFDNDGPLDMRMDNKGLSAYDLVNTFNENDIASIIYKYGEERFAKSIARNITRQRKTKYIETTLELASIVKKSIKIHPKKKIRKNPVTKTFQALRIYINNELEEIQEALKKAEKLLLPGGRIIIVSFNSLEDRLVKEYFNHNSGKKWRSSRHYPEPTDTGPITLKIITKKAIRPDFNEITTNPRSRSARLRVAEKLFLKSERFFL